MFVWFKCGLKNSNVGVGLPARFKIAVASNEALDHCFNPEFMY